MYVHAHTRVLVSPYVRVCVRMMHAESVCVPLIADSSHAR